MRNKITAGRDFKTAYCCTTFDLILVNQLLSLIEEVERFVSAFVHLLMQ